MMLKNNKPVITIAEANENESYGKFVVEPLDRGYGITLGNALRRVLLSSLGGAAVTALRVDGVYHEFSPVDGLIEDMTDIILNVKGIRIKMNVSGPKTLYLSVEEGETGVITAGDIVHDDEIEIMNPDHVIATLNGDSKVFMEFTVSEGSGYNTADENKWPNQPIGIITVDSTFTPVQKVNYRVENTRVGQVTDFDKLTIEVTTDATITAEDSLNEAASILIDQFSLFLDLEEEVEEEVEVIDEEEEERNELLDTAIEDMDFSVRTYNCLKRASINTIGDLTMRSMDDLLKVRNLGRKSLDEIDSKLAEIGLQLAPDSAEY